MEFKQVLLFEQRLFLIIITEVNIIRKNGVQDLRLVLNRFNKKQHRFICVDDIIDSVGARFLGIVPESNDIALTSIGEELPYDSKGNMAYLRIAKRLMGENIPFKIRNIQLTNKKI